MYIFTDACSIPNQQLSKTATLKYSLLVWVKLLPESALRDSHAALINIPTVDRHVCGLCISNCSGWLAMWLSQTGRHAMSPHSMSSVSP